MKLFCEIILIIHNNNITQNENIDPLLNIITTMYYNNFINQSIQFTIKNKFDHLETVINNKKLFAKTREHFICEFWKSQKIYWTLSRFFHKYRKNKKITNHSPPYYNSIILL